MMLRHCRTRPNPVVAVRWGPTFAEMRGAARWLDDNGVRYRWATDREYPPDAEYGLPDLVIYDPRWRAQVVSVGDWLVLRARGDAVVEHRETLDRTYETRGTGRGAA